jgi:hypothetical protein
MRILKNQSQNRFGETFKKLCFCQFEFGGKMRLNIGQHVYWKIGIARSKFYFHKSNKVSQDAELAKAFKQLEELNRKMRAMDMDPEEFGG